MTCFCSVFVLCLTLDLLNTLKLPWSIRNLIREDTPKLPHIMTQGQIHQNKAFLVTIDSFIGPGNIRCVEGHWGTLRTILDSIKVTDVFWTAKDHTLPYERQGIDCRARIRYLWNSYLLVANIFITFPFRLQEDGQADRHASEKSNTVGDTSDCKLAKAL